MKRLTAVLSASALILMMSGCSQNIFQSRDDSGQQVTEPAFSETAAETSPVSEPEEVPEAAEVSPAESSVPDTPEEDYEDIPSVAWTEINFEKTMYTVSACFGYDTALPDGKKAVSYDPGYEILVTARTNTGYYRVEDDWFIPCEDLAGSAPEDADTPSATCSVIVKED